MRKISNYDVPPGKRQQIQLLRDIAEGRKGIADIDNSAKPVKVSLDLYGGDAWKSAKEFKAHCMALPDYDPDTMYVTLIL